MGICLACNDPNQSAAFCTACGKELRLQRRYVAERVLGQGAFGKTFLATDEGKPSKPRCVIKQFIYHDPNTRAKALELFDEEAVRLDDLGQHPQIPTLLAHCQQDGRSYLVQEFVDGENLQRELDHRGAFTEAQVRDLLGQVLVVLDYIHRRQVIHRDIKPENIMRRRSDQQLVLVDFGAAKYASATALAKTGTTIGSASYAAPEQARGKAVFASDLYGLGVTCLHLLTGVDPSELFDDLNLSFAWRDFLNEKSVSAEFGNVLDKLTQYRPVDRYGSVAEVLEALGKPASGAANSNSVESQPNPPIVLTSAEGIDYRELELLLKTKQWRKADELTAQLMLKVANREQEGWLHIDNIATFSCEDLRTLNQLWVYYSSSKFGFSVQKKLWLKCGGKIETSIQYLDDNWFDYNGEKVKEFALQVGWYHDNEFSFQTYKKFMQNTQNARKALPASLPAIWGTFTTGWFGMLKQGDLMEVQLKLLLFLLPRLVKCDI
jgi:serine/threonine protein kinase